MSTKSVTLSTLVRDAGATGAFNNTEVPAQSSSSPGATQTIEFDCSGMRIKGATLLIWSTGMPFTEIAIKGGPSSSINRDLGQWFSGSGIPDTSSLAGAALDSAGGAPAIIPADLPYLGIFGTGGGVDSVLHAQLVLPK